MYNTMEIETDSETVMDMDMSITSPLVTSPVTEEDINEIETFYRGLDIIDLVWFKLLKRTVSNTCFFPVYISTEVEMDWDEDFIDTFVEFKDYTNHKQLSESQISQLLSGCGKDTVSVMFAEVKYLNYLHSNVFIIDHSRKMVEHYEPHGDYTFWETAYDQDFQTVLEHQLKDTFKGLGYSYSRVHNVCHQTNYTNDKLIQDTGYCNVYSGWFALYRCQNMNYSLEEFTILIDKIQKERGVEYIARYAKVVMKEIDVIAKKYNIFWDNLDDLNDYIRMFDLFETEMN
jgi:hypothetical protein